MKKIQYLFLSALAILIFSCSSNNENEFTPVYNGNIDGGDWINSQTIGNYGGYTGDRCSKVDSVNEYSFGLSKLFNEISANPVNKIKVSVWVKLSDLNKKSTLVVSVKGTDNKNLLWSGHDLNPLVKEAGKWTKIEVEDVLTNINTEGAIAGIYVWNSNKNTVYIDDYKIQFLPE
ncbi:MAG: hypothetical protein HGB12_07025 [Bacteroidetes bacterium]|nr:hypothetical protein [Bacteroidota bacterium]